MSSYSLFLTFYFKITLDFQKFAKNSSSFCTPFTQPPPVLTSYITAVRLVRARNYHDILLLTNLQNLFECVGRSPRWTSGSVTCLKYSQNSEKLIHSWSWFITAKGYRLESAKEKTYKVESRRDQAWPSSCPSSPSGVVWTAFNSPCVATRTLYL